MEDLKLFTKEEKEKLRSRIKSFKNCYSFQLMKMKYFDELNTIDKTISAMSCEQIEEFKDVVKKDIEKLKSYKKDLVESLGFVFEK